MHLCNTGIRIVHNRNRYSGLHKSFCGVPEKGIVGLRTNSGDCIIASVMAGVRKRAEPIWSGVLLRLEWTGVGLHVSYGTGMVHHSGFAASK